jgi:hypothetical protein
MALGEVTVNALNLQQGEFPEIEKYFLFIGEAPENQDTLLFLNTDSDLDVVLGAADSELKTQILAARSNAGQNWAACAVPVADGTLWEAAFDYAMNENVRVEACVVTTPVTSQAELTAMHTKAEDTTTQFGRRLFFIAAVAGILPATQTWSDYVTAINNYTDGLSAYRVSVVPQIYPDAQGIYAGRLCNYQISIADTPMRVATGTLIGRDASQFPVDLNGERYNNAHAKALNDARYSVPQTYPDYEGVYWTDGQMLDVAIGDFQVVENLRVVDKAARNVRLVLLGLLGDRRFNSSAIGETWAISKMMRPLREMSRSYEFQGIPFPAELKSPKEGDIQINWITRTKVDVFMIARPFEVPKEITANIMLDLSAPVA